jgi:hypothetical protein
VRLEVFLPQDCPFIVKLLPERGFDFSGCSDDEVPPAPASQAHRRSGAEDQDDLKEQSVHDDAPQGKGVDHPPQELGNDQLTDISDKKEDQAKNIKPDVFLCQRQDCFKFF